MSSKRASQIMKRWSAELDSKDKTIEAVTSNFEDLFYELWKASISFDDAESLISEAISIHLPDSFIAKQTYKRIKHVLKGKTFNEFMDSWKKKISDKAYQAFYTHYPIEGENQKEEKKYGNMSAQEYSKQRRYADAFPVLDVDALKRQVDEVLEDIDDMTADLEEDNG